MDKNQLTYFVSLTQALNFSRVAKQYFISQPALTNQIAKLEAELGVQLFNRSKHGVSLTFAGSEFRQYAVNILNQMMEEESRMNDVSKGAVGFLDISSTGVAETVMTEYVAVFHQRFPCIHIRMDCGNGGHQVGLINQRAFDLYFSVAPLLRSFDTIETIPLRPDRCAVYINRRYAHLVRPDDLSGLRALPHIMESSTNAPFLLPKILDILSLHGLESCQKIYYPQAGTIFSAVQAGLGFAILPSHMNLAVWPEDILVVPIAGEEASIQLALGWHRDSQKNAVEEFIKLAQELYPGP